jgi:hypothetical protein
MDLFTLQGLQDLGNGRPPTPPQALTDDISLTTVENKIISKVNNRHVTINAPSLGLTYIVSNIPTS